MLAWTHQGRLGVDMEPFEPSSALQAAAELLLPSEQTWAAGFPAQDRWQAFLGLWTAKEAVLKALGQGFAIGVEQVELGPDGRGGMRLLRLCGSERLAQGWCLELHQRTLGTQRFLVALAVAAPSGITAAG
jgi:4'-phosphopantetheinyl transferase